MIGIALGALLGFTFVGLLHMARAAGTRHAPHPATGTAAFKPAPDGTRWLPCDDTACGHMTTRHLAQPDGSVRCEHSQTHHGAVQP